MTKLPTWLLLMLACLPALAMVAAAAWWLTPSSSAPEAAMPTRSISASGQGPAAAPAATAPVATAPAATAPAPAGDALTTVRLRSMQGGAAVEGAPDVFGRVSYAGNTAELPASAQVFVFVRRAGQRMPLAVERFDPRTLPVRAAFGPLPKDGGVEMVARLSLDGSVQRGGEDPEVVRELKLPGPEKGAELELTIPALPR